MAVPTASACPDAVLGLVARFRDHIDHYKGPGYNETRLRREFVDPLFHALGWDVQNAEGRAAPYREVLHEDSIQIAGSAKAPDYAFRIGSTRKFFVETKKPAIHILLHAESAYQLRRYAWSAKLPLSILTDFEEFAVYDTRIRPAKSDSPSKARVLYVTFEEYEKRWPEIAGIFGRDAILRGAFDKFAESTKKRGTTEVDDAFLTTIREWREALAKDIHKQNELSERQLNHSVQTIIDRIIFLRICEDRGVEEFARLLALKDTPPVYPALVKLFHAADARYNSGLFHFQNERDRPSEPDTLTPALEVSDRVLKKIIDDLYYPSPYDFRVFPPDVLGQVYERFLGDVITLSKTGKTLKIEPKPEVRKAGGVYYTPTYIVDYIVQHTVGELVKGKQPHEVAGRTEKQFKTAKNEHPIRVLDPACGSGSFLLGAYQFLLDWYRREYETDTKRWTAGAEPTLWQAGENDFRLTIAERKRILLDHIYGVDIDRQAVEVTKLSLLLKCLEGESSDTIGAHLYHMHERALPDLAANIKCGNSLIAPDFYDGKDPDEFTLEDRLGINAFDWEREFKPVFADGGFDAVIGNPPYDVLEKDRRKASWPHQSLLDYVNQNKRLAPALGGKTNLFRFFCVQATTLVREDGHFGAIIPLAIMGDQSCSTTRRHIACAAPSIRVDCFPQKDSRARRVFRDAKQSTCVLIWRCRWRATPDESVFCVTTHPGRHFQEVSGTVSVRYADAALLDPVHVPIPLTDESSWRTCVKIHSRAGTFRIEDTDDITITRGEINQTVYSDAITNRPTGHRLVKGVEIGRYSTNSTLSQGQQEWISPSDLPASKQQASIVSRRRIATQRITGIDEKWRIVATIIDPPAYFADSTNSITARDDRAFLLGFALGVLNSRLFQWRFKVTSSNNNVATNQLESLPWRSPTSSGENLSVAEAISRLAWNLIDSQVRASTTGSPDECRILQQQFDATDREIDRLVYDLYGLTDDEIAIVERATAPAE